MEPAFLQGGTANCTQFEVGRESDKKLVFIVEQQSCAGISRNPRKQSRSFSDEHMIEILTSFPWVNRLTFGDAGSGDGLRSASCRFAAQPLGLGHPTQLLRRVL